MQSFFVEMKFDSLRSTEFASVSLYIVVWTVVISTWPVAGFESIAVPSSSPPVTSFH